MDSVPSGIPLSQIPVLRPPPGVKSNFIDPPTLANPIIAVNVVFLVLMLIALTIRVYTKAFLLKTLWWDDYTALVAAAGSIVSSGLTIQQTGHALGRHMWDVPLSLFKGNDMQILRANGVASHPTYLFVKLSVLLLYFRLFSIKRKLRWLIWAGILLQIIGYTAFFGHSIGLMVICNNPRISLTDTFCRDSLVNTYTQALFSVLTDFYVLVLPIGIVLKLQISFRRKIGVSMVFATGLLACMASIARAIITIQRLHPYDRLYQAGYITISSAVEINTGIIAGALITFPPFFSKSGVGTFTRSAIASLRNRLWGRINSSDWNGKMHNEDGPHVELGDCAKAHVGPWQEVRDIGWWERGIGMTDDCQITVDSELSLVNTNAGTRDTEEGNTKSCV